jgi:hypothetical protein
VMRMPDNLYSSMAFSCKPVGGVRGRGAPKATFTHARAYDGETSEWARLERRRFIPDAGSNGWGVPGMYESAQDRVSCLARVFKLSLKPSKSNSHPPQLTRPYLSRAFKEGGSC